MQRLWLAAALLVAAAFGLPASAMVKSEGNSFGASCAVTGASPQTCNALRGVVTTGTLTTAAVTNAAYTINNATVTASSLVLCTDEGYSGTLVTNGEPAIMSCVPGAGTITVNITNVHAANAMNGTVKIGFLVIN